MTLAYAADLDRNIFALFEQQAARRPAATAVMDLAGDTSYVALMMQAHSVADELIRRGLAPEQPVGVMMQRTAGLIATLLGILEAGGCYVPLDPDDPPERSRRIVAGAGLQIVLGNKELLADFGSYLRSAEEAIAPPELVDIEPFILGSSFATGAEAGGFPGANTATQVLLRRKSEGASFGPVRWAGCRA